MRAVNLIPADQRSSGSVGAGRSGGGAYAVLAAFAGIALMALLYGLAHHQYNSRQKEAADYSAKAQQAQSEVTSLTPYTSFVAMRHQRAEAVESLVNARFDWAHTFHEFARVLPSDASISSLTGTVGETGAPGSAPGSEKKKGAPNPATSTESAGGAPTTPKAPSTAVTPATPAGSVPVFTVQGCATTQQAVADTINRLRLIDGVASVQLQSSTASSTPSGGGSAGGCGSKEPAYVLVVTFQPLPSSSQIVSTAKAATVADTKGTSR